MTIIQAIYENSLKYPNKLAIAASDGELTYQELWDYAIKFSQYINSLQIPKNMPIVIQGMQNSAFIIVLLSVLLHEGIIVPISKDITDDSLNDIISKTQACYVFNQTTLKDFTLKGIQTLLQISAPPPLTINHTIIEENISDILFTTGTTGTPEGIIHTHKSHYATVENILHCLNMQKNNITLITSPLNHSFGLRRLYANLVNGSSIIILENIFPIDNFFKLINKYNINSIVMNPSTISIILTVARTNLSKYAKQITYIEFTGSILKQNIIETLIEVLPNTCIYNMYGSTEAGVMLGCNISKYKNKINSIGTPNINSHIIILDKNNKEVTGFGKEHAGYLSIRSPIIMKGYLNNEEKTKEALKDNLYITKDIVYKDEDNFYYFIARESDIINIGGLKIAPEEIEDIVNLYSGVIESACIGKKDEIAGEFPVLFIVKNNFYTSSDFNNYIKNKMEKHKHPKEIYFIKEIPRTFNGKISRKILRDLLKE